MKVSNYYLSLDEMRFFAHHGCSEQERAAGGEFVVSLRMKVDKTDALHSDTVQDTVDYAAVYNQVKIIMDCPCRLIEHVAARIMNELLTTYTEMSALTIRISKLNPPIEESEMKSASAELHYER